MVENNFLCWHSAVASGIVNMELTEFQQIFGGQMNGDSFFEMKETSSEPDDMESSCFISSRIERLCPQPI